MVVMVAACGGDGVKHVPDARSIDARPIDAPPDAATCITPRSGLIGW
jgi:hypothetical protein